MTEIDVKEKNTFGQKMNQGITSVGPSVRLSIRRVSSINAPAQST